MQLIMCLSHFHVDHLDFCLAILPAHGSSGFLSGNLTCMWIIWIFVWQSYLHVDHLDFCLDGDLKPLLCTLFEFVQSDKRYECLIID